MWRNLLARLFGRKAAGEFAQFAITFPLMAIITVGMLNLSFLGYVNQAATNAANAGARAGSVNQQSPAAAAYSTATRAAETAGLGWLMSVSATGGGFPGARIVVTVSWEVPNLIPFLVPGGNFQGETYSVFRQEGW